MLERAVFLDRDNTIIENDGYLGDPSRVKLLPGAATALASMRQLGYRLIVVSNQSGVARGMFNENAVEAVNAEMSRQLQEQAGAHIDASYYCPYHPDAPLSEYRVDHDWRKPRPGMLKQAATDFRLDLAQCWMIGDQNRDMGAGAAAGCRTILLKDPDRTPALDTNMGKTVSPNFVVRTLADAARIIAREGRNPPPPPPVAPAPDHSAPIVAGPAARAEAAPAETPAEPAEDKASPAPITPAPVADARPAARQPQPAAPAATSAGVIAPSRTDRLLEELVSQLRQQNRHAELHPEFSASNIVALILQILAAAALVVGIHKFLTARVAFKDIWSEYFLAHYERLDAAIWLLIALVLQGMVIALLLRARRKH